SLGQVAPDCFPQVGQIQTSEYAVPIGVVALRSSECAPGSGRISAGPAQEGERLHLLVHPIGLGVLHQEIAPVSASDQGSVRTGDAGLAEITLQADEPEG